jgi:hypothetical protein
MLVALSRIPLKKPTKINMKEQYIIEYLNCKKDFQKDSVQFKGSHAYEEAITWGKKNLENFHLDMIKVVYPD